MKLTQQLFFQYFKRYIERELTQNNSRRTWNPLTGWKEIKKKTFTYNEHRPWTNDFKQENILGKKEKYIPVEPIKEINIFKGDRVMILTGKDKGKIGLIASIIKERNWVYVEGLNCEYLMQTSSPGTLPTCIKKEKPLLMYKQVKLIDPSDNESTDISWKYLESGERVRVSERTGRILPVPGGAQELEDFVNPLNYVASAKDTLESDVLEVTYKPTNKIFEEDINDVLGIKEDRKRAKTYWY